MSQWKQLLILCCTPHSKKWFNFSLTPFVCESQLLVGKNSLSATIKCWWQAQCLQSALPWNVSRRLETGLGAGTGFQHCNGQDHTWSVVTTIIATGHNTTIVSHDYILIFQKCWLCWGSTLRAWSLWSPVTDLIKIQPSGHHSIIVSCLYFELPKVLVVLGLNNESMNELRDPRLDPVNDNGQGVCINQLFIASVNNK